MTTAKHRDDLKKLPANNREMVEARLDALRNCHRLGIHTFESEDWRLLYPAKTLGELKANEKIPLPELLRSGNPALFSLSLLPRKEKSLVPFTGNLYYAGAYLFDLSAKPSGASPLVVKCLNNAHIYTGYENHDKSLFFHLPTDIPALDALYAGHTAYSFKKAVADNPQLSEQQLDAFGEYGERTHFKLRHTTSWNECIAALTRDHIAAIAIPFDAYDHDENKSFKELRGALSGIEHLKHGINKPVVLYNINDPDITQIGKCIYVAQGREECKRVAIDSIRNLQDNGEYEMLEYVREECRALLNIDIDKLIDTQLSARGRR